MNPFFTDFLTLGLMASAMALVVLFIRSCFRRIPKTYTYILWIFVFIRAVLPVSYSSPLGLWTLFQNEPRNGWQTTLSVQAGEPSYLSISETSDAHSLPANPPTNAFAAQSMPAKTPSPIMAITVLWAAGCLTMLFYSLASLLKLHKRVRFAVQNQVWSKKCGVPVLESDQIQSAFLYGFFRPAIYLPRGLSERQAYLILEHETAHIRRHDHQVKLIAWLILSLYWFLPLLWVSFYFLDKDMELSCDERVLKQLGTNVRTEYGSLLLKLAAQENFTGQIPVSFCRGSSKTRIKHVMRYRPQKAFSASFAVLLVSITLYGCMGGPKEQAFEQTAESLQTEAATDKTMSDASEAFESEELSFAKKFVSTVCEGSINIIADDIYEMLSPELQAEIPDFGTGTLDIMRLETGHYMTCHAPFTPGEPTVTAESDNVFQYQIPPASNEPEFFWAEIDEDLIWNGRIQVERNADGEFQVAKWENEYFNPVNSRIKYVKHYSPDSTLQFIAETIPSREEWKQICPDDVTEELYNDTYGEPWTYLEKCLHLTGGKMTDVQTDDATQDKQFTYTWEDGSVVFYARYRAQDNIWIPYKTSL